MEQQVLPVVAATPAKVEEPESNAREKRKEVLQLVQKEGPLTKKELDFCDDACIDRYLKARGNNVRRAARMLRATLNWREKIEIGYMIADEFPADIAAGSAYVAGYDEDGRPVLIIKKKPDHILNHTQRQYLRYLIFTIEVALAAMTPEVDQWVLIFDARGYSKTSAPSPSGILTTLKILSDHYPERLAKAFIVDASSMFYHVWKGMCTFVDHPTRGKLHFAYTKDYKGTSKTQQSLKATPLSPSSENAPRRPSNACAEEFKYPVSPQIVTPGRNDVSLPTVYDSSPKKADQELTRGKLSDGPELIHSVRTRSFSFSSIMTMSYTAPEPRDGESSSFRKEEPDEIVEEEPEVVVTSSVRSKPIRGPWDGLVSIFHSQKKDEAHKKVEYKKKYPSRKEERKEERKDERKEERKDERKEERKDERKEERKDERKEERKDERKEERKDERKEERKEEEAVVDEQNEDEYKKDELQKKDEPRNRPADSFLPYLSFVQEPYSEASYRALMKPPLGGLAMIISTELKHMDSF